LLESLDLIEKNYDAKAVKELPSTARLPSRSPTKTMLVAWVLRNVAKHRQTSKYGRSTFEEARKAEQF
ncbi:hypothetical protein K443DRAFT_54299, partial [Laccaria amethystina LaAM-08-1]